MILNNVRIQLNDTDSQTFRNKVSIERADGSGGRIENECYIAYSPSHPGGIGISIFLKVSFEVRKIDERFSGHRRRNKRHKNTRDA
jgi:hypothetical protein